ncbi:cytochrome P450 4V2-like [Varroa destructor]|uniref:Cytochrome P450 n=1 Tax=Varroa destructor TaxID=109461 RepID=A0A7M7KKR6_VARDE|nr:cytochrome P450 4V2-like [Varroa destructor]XP_022666637.1 cytochrome P450 4V2-like [Varroa destructor]
MTYVGSWLLILELITVMLITAYVAAFLKRRQTIIAYPIPGPQPSILNIFWPFGSELYIVMEQYMKNVRAGQALYELMDSLTSKYRSYGLYRMWFTFRPIVVLTRGNRADCLLKSTVETYKAKEVALIETWLGQGLLTSNGPKWQRKRKMLTPVFHFNILEEFMPTMNKQAAQLTEILLEQQNKRIDIFSYLGKCALNIICETAMGISIDAQRTENEYINSLRLITEGYMKRHLTPWLWSDIIYRISPSGREYFRNLKVAHEFTRKVISIRMKELQEQPSLTEEVADESGVTRKKRPLLDSLLTKHLQDKEPTMEEIREEIDTFIFTGHDTVAVALMWSLYLLGLHPEVQAKVHDELDRVFGDDRTRAIITEDLNKLKYLECVIKETLRLYPSAPLIAREVIHGCNIGEYHLTSGVTVFIDIFHIHRDPEVFENAEKFDPDRFLPQNAANLKPYAFIPFSGGPRNCVGQKFAIQEDKIVLATLLRRLQVKSLVPQERMKVFFEVVLRPAELIELEVRERPKDNNNYFK